MSEKRFVVIDDDEVYYITDTQGLKTLEDLLKVDKDSLVGIDGIGGKTADKIMEAIK